MHQAADRARISCSRGAMQEVAAGDQRKIYKNKKIKQMLESRRTLLDADSTNHMMQYADASMQSQLYLWLLCCLLHTGSTYSSTDAEWKTWHGHLYTGTRQA